MLWARFDYLDKINQLNDSEDEAMILRKSTSTLLLLVMLIWSHSSPAQQTGFGPTLGGEEGRFDSAEAACIANAKRWTDRPHHLPDRAFVSSRCEPDDRSITYLGVKFRRLFLWLGEQLPDTTLWTHSYVFYFQASSTPIGESLGNDCCESMLGNPIHITNGNKYQEEVDHRDPQDQRFNFARHYNSKSKFNSSGFGSGWTHSFYYRIEALNNYNNVDLDLFRPDGKILRFIADGNNKWKPRIGAGIQVIFNPGVGYEVTNSVDQSIEKYDESGLLQSITYKDFYSLDFIYDDSRRLLEVQDYFSRRLYIDYDDNGGIREVSNPAGSIVYEFDQGRLSSVSSLGEEQKSYEYNAQGFLTHILDGSGNILSVFGYDRNGDAVGTLSGGSSDSVYKDRDSILVQTRFGASSNLTFDATSGFSRKTGSTEKYSSSNIKSATYNSLGNRIGSLDFRGYRESMEYSPNGLMVRHVEAVGTSSERTVEREWDEASRLLLQERVYNADQSLLITRVYSYNSRGQVVLADILDPNTNSLRGERFVYCEEEDVLVSECPRVGLLTSRNSAYGSVLTSFKYYMTDDIACLEESGECSYRRGYLKSSADGLGRVREYQRYDRSGNILSVKDFNNVVTSFKYNPQGLISSINVQGGGGEDNDRVTRIEYWPAGLIKKVTQPDGAFTTYDYDNSQRLVKIGDNFGNTINFTLDDYGNRIAEEVRDAGTTLRRTLSRVFDQLGRITTQADASANPTDYFYDANGNLSMVVDALGREFEKSYDPLNRLVRVLQDVGGIESETTFEYDALDNLTRVVDPKGLETRYNYNAFGDLISLESPDTGTTTYSYDGVGNRIGQVDARGQITTYVYDAVGRPTSVLRAGVADQDVDYVYDIVQEDCGLGETFPVGRLAAMRDHSGSTHYCYNRFGELVRKVQVTNGRAYTLLYAYTKGGNLQRMTYPDGSVADYVRDGLGQVTEISVISPSGVRQILLTDVDSYPFGPISGWTYGNGIRLDRSYDLDYRPQSISDTGVGGLDYGYSYDPVGNLSGLHTGDLAEPPRARFSYDTLGRLTAFRDGVADTPIERYAYDATGNRTEFTNSIGTQAYSYSADSHRLAAVGDVGRSYDPVGNTLTDGSGRTFFYNSANRLGRVEREGSTAQHYAYNGKGERVRRYSTSGDVVTLFNEMGRWLGDYDIARGVVQQAIWLEDLPVGLIAQPQQGVDTESPATLEPFKLYHIQPDHLGTPRAVIDPNRNAVIWSWDLTSEALGDSPPNQDPDSDGVSFVFDMRFPGQRYDVASGLNYNYFRDYEAGSGRYTQSDPVGQLGGVSTYAYANNSPLTWIDPRGLTAAVGTYPGYYPPGGTSPVPGARPSTWPGARGFPLCLNPIVGGIMLMMVPGNIGQDASCSDDPRKERQECRDAEDERCDKVLRGCRAKCLDILVEDPNSLPGMGSDYFGRQRRCLRECMEEQMCFNY